jgi:hypothetical protein
MGEKILSIPSPIGNASLTKFTVDNAPKNNMLIAMARIASYRVIRRSQAPRIGVASTVAAARFARVCRSCRDFQSCRVYQSCH